MNKQVYNQALRERRLVKFPEGPKLVKKEIGAAMTDLKTAKESWRKKDYKWTTIQGYYAIFHAARALIYSRKIKEKTHYHLVVAVKVLFADEYLLNKKFVFELQEAMGLREKADYESEYSSKDAKYVLDVAGDFIKEVKGIVKT